MSTDDKRPPIPEPIKRIVRQRCGFGCVVCGHPIVHYEHIYGWRQTGNDPNGLTLLCGNHHEDKTGGALPVEKLLEYNVKPRNTVYGKSKAYLLNYYGNECVIKIGSNNFHIKQGTIMNALLIDNISIVGFELEDGQLFLHFAAFDGEGNLIAQIRKNELEFLATKWDITFSREGPLLIIRERKGEIILTLKFKPPKIVEVTKASFSLNGIHVFVESGVMGILNNATFITGGNYTEVNGIGLGRTLFGGVSIEVDRSPIDRKEKIKEFRKKVRRMKKK